MCIFVQSEIIFLVGGPLKVLEKWLHFFSMNPVTQYGTCSITREFPCRKWVATFFVADADTPALLGLLIACDLNLITLHCFV